MLLPSSTYDPVVVDVVLGERCDADARGGGELELAIHGAGRHCVGDGSGRLLGIGKEQLPTDEGIRPTLGDGRAGVVDHHRWVIIDRGDGEAEALPGDRVALAIVDIEAEAVRGGITAIMDVDHAIEVDVVLGERGDAHTRRGGELQLPITRRCRDGVSH